ncbi:GL25075 [Drosophila persimilis]|uniref:GL25075 n=1 Tax=Drosophila persimilis TaxID=7234 RepID=B4GQW2_DROPE|nr:GL25075 [Drosophila persimilis]
MALDGMVSALLVSIALTGHDGDERHNCRVAGRKRKRNGAASETGLEPRKW